MRTHPFDATMGAPLQSNPIMVTGSASVAEALGNDCQMLP